MPILVKSEHRELQPDIRIRVAGRGRLTVTEKCDECGRHAIYVYGARVLYRPHAIALQTMLTRLKGR